MRNIPDYTLEICIDYGYKRLNKKIKHKLIKEDVGKGEIEVKVLIKDLLTPDLKTSKIGPEKDYSTSGYDDDDFQTPLGYYDYEDDEDHFYNINPHKNIDYDETDLL